MFEQLKKDVADLLRIEKERAEVNEAYQKQLEKVRSGIVCPVCHKQARVHYGAMNQIVCEVCGLSTGSTYSLKDLFQIWLTFCLAFDEDSSLAKTLKELQALGGKVTIEKGEEAESEEADI